MKLKKLEDLEDHCCCIDGCCMEDLAINSRDEAINWIKNLQSNKTKYPIVLDALPDTMKGSIPKKLWYETEFRLGAEYGMISWIMYFFDITEEDLKD